MYFLVVIGFGLKRIGRGLGERGLVSKFLFYFVR